MASDEDPVALAKGTIDSDRYMTPGTADEAGHPWVSPVFYAARGYAEFYWMSSPEVTHSQNLARRPQLSIVIFDSRVVPGNARPVCARGPRGFRARSTGGHSTTGPG